MPLSPLQGGTTIKPNSTDPRPTTQTYFRDDCTTLVVHDFLNELISLFVNANVYLGLPNAQNDPDALRKMFQAVFTGKKDFDISDLRVFNKIADGAVLSFYETDNTRGGYIALNESLNYLTLTKQTANVDKNKIILKDTFTEFTQPIKVDRLQELSLGNGLRFISDPFVTTNRLQFGEPSATRRQYIQYDDLTDTFGFFENSNARAATVLAGGGNFNTLKVGDISEVVTNAGITIEGTAFKDGAATIAKVLTGLIESTGSVVIKLDTNANSTSDSFQIREANSRNIFVVNDDGYTQIRKQLGSEVLGLVHEGAGNAIDATPYIGFRYAPNNASASTRIGYIGFANSQNYDLYLSNEYGDNRFTVAAGFEHVFNETLTVPELTTNNITGTTPNTGLRIEGLTVKGQNLNFGQGSFLNHYSEVEFIPNASFANEGLLTAKEGLFIRTGAKADVFIRVAGPASARYNTASIIMAITNIPTADLVVRRSVFSIVERLGSYPNRDHTTQGFFNSSTNHLHFVHPETAARNTAKTVADWAAGDFDFYITGTLFFK